MFGIGGGEFLVIIIIVLMFFGSDKIPEIARALGKGMAQLKNATNDIKGEISKGMADTGIDPNALTNGITDEINKAKQGFTKMVNDSEAKSSMQNELDQIRENFAKMGEAEIAEANSEIPEANAATPETNPVVLPEGDGPIKRQH